MKPNLQIQKRIILLSKHLPSQKRFIREVSPLQAQAKEQEMLQVTRENLMVIPAVRITVEVRALADQAKVDQAEDPN